MENERYARGLKRLAQLDPEAPDRLLRSTAKVAPFFARYGIEFAFGDVYCRSGLDLASRQIATIAALAAMGNAKPQLKVHIHGALQAGCSVEEVTEVLAQMALYAGFPAGFNALYAAEEVFDERAQRGEPRFTERSVQLKDHVTAVVDVGKSDIPTILIHGLGLNWRTWHSVLGPTSESGRVIAYDLRGHGEARDAPLVEDIASLAADVANLLDRMELPRAHVAGCALGGAVALQFALDFPERTGGLTMIGAPFKSLSAFSERANTAEQDGVEAQLATTLVRWFTPMALARNEWFVRFARNCVLGMRKEAWVSSWRALASIDFVNRLGSLRAPVRIVAGELDASMTPSAMQELHSYLPRSRYHVLPGAPHMMTLESPAAVARVLAERW